jgi:hypothetical protein
LFSLDSIFLFISFFSLLLSFFINSNSLSFLNFLIPILIYSSFYCLWLNGWIWSLLVVDYLQLVLVPQF